MKNLAGKQDCDKYIRAELLLAGIHAVDGDYSRGEVPYSVTGMIHGWHFRRAWYYWVATATPGAQLSAEKARRLNERWKEEVRVDGYAGGQDVEGPVGCYHVDTVEGLSALVEYISPEVTK